MIILIDRSFVHLITLKNQLISILVRLVIDVIDYEQDSFTYIIIEHYTLKEFYNVMINTDVSKKSTISYRQYLIYKITTNDNTDIDTM